MSSGSSRKSTNDVHFGDTKQIAFSSDQQSIYSLGSNDGVLFKITRNQFSAAPTQISHSSLKDAITSFEIIPDSNDIFVSIKDTILLLKNLPEITKVQQIYKDPDGAEIQSIKYHYNSNNLLVITSNVATWISDKGKIIKTVYSDDSKNILWADVGPTCGTIVILTETEWITINGVSLEVDQVFSTGSSSLAMAFAPSSDLLICNPSTLGVIDIYCTSDGSKSSVIIPKVSSRISHIVVSESSHMALGCADGKVIIAKYDRGILKFANEAPQSQPISTICIITYDKDQLTCLSWGAGGVAGGNGEGTDYLWDNVIPEDMPSVSESVPQIPTKIKPTPKPKKTKATSHVAKKIDIASALTAPVPENKRPKDEDFSLSEMDEDEPIEKKKPEPKPKPKKPKSKSKSKPKPKTKKHDSEYDEEEDGEVEGLIDDGVPVIYDNEPSESEPESETSEGHDISDPDAPKDEDSEAGAIYKDMAASSDSDSEEGDELIDEHITIPFNPNACFEFLGNRRYLAWNLTGAVFLRASEEDENESFIDIHPYPGSNVTEQHFTNASNFVFASIDQFGFLGASYTTAVYRLHNKWAPDSECSIMIHGDSIRCIAMGENWFALGTDGNVVHIFTSSGFEIAVFQVSSGIKTMVGSGSRLMIIYGESLRFKLLSIRGTFAEIARGEVAVSQPLRWAGFDSNLIPIVLDGEYIVSRLSGDFGWSWVPICDLSATFNEATTGFWVVGESGGSIYGVQLEGTPSPATASVPQLHEFETAPYTVDVQSTSYLQQKLDQSVDQEDRELNADVELLKSFSVALKEGKELRAMDTAKLIKHEALRDAAVRFSDKSGHAEFTDRLVGEKSSVPHNKKVTKYIEGDSESRSEILQRLHRSNTTSEEEYVRPSTEVTKNTIVENKPSAFLSALTSMKSDISNKKAKSIFGTMKPTKSSSNAPLKKKPAPKKKENVKVADITKLLHNK